jgi:hypothetical protein
MTAAAAATQHLRLPNFVSPTTSPAVARAGRPLRKTSLRLCQKKRKQLKLPKMMANNTSTVPHHSHPSPSTTTTTITSTTPEALQFSAARGTTLKKILRKKFSWKNYPGMLCTDRKGSPRLLMRHHTYYSHYLLLLPSSLLRFRTGSLFDCQSRGVPSTLGSQLHGPTEAIQ